jgi:ribonuclease-3
MDDVTHLQQKIEIAFNNPALLKSVLIHSSYINEKAGMGLDSNERLEFLGDAVLGLVIAQKLFQDFPQSTEGELTRLRSALVRRETLAHIAATINLGEYLVMGKGEEGGGGRNKQANLAGALEALIGAIYLDQNIGVVRNFIFKLFGQEIYKQAHLGVNTDYKSILQEVIQAEHQIAPSYHLIEATGPDHAKQFVVEVREGNNILARGTGKSKKIAEMEAARAVLESLNKHISPKQN